MKLETLQESCASVKHEKHLRLCEPDVTVRNMRASLRWSNASASKGEAGGCFETRMLRSGQATESTCVQVRA